MTLTTKLLAAGALAAVVAFPVSAALAQDSAPMGNSGSSASSASGSMGESNSMGAQSSAPASQVDDATLQKAAKAYVKVKQIVHQSKQSGQADQTSSQMDKLNAVKNEGLDPQQYNQILQMVQNDPQLQQKFAGYVTQNGGDAD
jgi:hypothetical protein